MSRRLRFPGPEYPGAWVDVPNEWLGEHRLKRDAAVRAAAKYNDGGITIAAIALCIADDWGGIPGLEGKNPSAWDFAQMPIVLMAWLEAAVFDDFARAFVVPKVYSPPPPRGWMARMMAMIQKRLTVGSSALNR